MAFNDPERVELLAPTIIKCLTKDSRRVKFERLLVALPSKTFIAFGHVLEVLLAVEMTDKDKCTHFMVACTLAPSAFITIEGYSDWIEKLPGLAVDYERCYSGDMFQRELAEQWFSGDNAANRANHRMLYFRSKRQFMVKKIVQFFNIPCC